MLRAKWDGGSTLTDVKDILVADAYHGGPGSPQGLGPASGSYGSRLAWDRAGFLYVSLGDRNYPAASQDPASHIGKILRISDDGSVPPDNPFVSKAGIQAGDLHARSSQSARPLRSSGDRRALVDRRGTAGRRRAEHDRGGQELRLAATCRSAATTTARVVGEGFSAPGLEEPVVFWVPAIAISGLSFYDGDKFPQWKGNAFVGAMRNNTGQHIQRVQFNAKGEPTGREIFLARAEAAHPRGEAGARRVHLRHHRRDLWRGAEDRTGSVNLPRTFAVYMRDA